MSLINYAKKEINCKVIYFGPGLSGKTTNVQYVYEHTHNEQKGKLVSLSTENERTLFYDFLPLSIGGVRGYQIKFLLYTVPGQTFYEVSREVILKGVDGIVFVADSQPECMEANIEAFDSLKSALDRQGYDLDRLPLVFQYNKRDVSRPIPVADLERALNTKKRPHFEAVANRGEGVMETLEAVCHWIIRDLKSGEGKTL